MYLRDYVTESAFRIHLFLKGKSAMNSTFKVVFNKARGALMVVNEITSCVQAKGTKTVVAAAVATMIAGVAGTAMANTTANKNTNTVYTKEQATEVAKIASFENYVPDEFTIQGTETKYKSGAVYIRSAQTVNPEFADLFYAYGVLDSSRFIGESSHLVGLGSNQASFYLRA